MEQDGIDDFALHGRRAMDPRRRRTGAPRESIRCDGRARISHALAACTDHHADRARAARRHSRAPQAR